MDFIEKIYTDPDYYNTVKNTILNMMKSGINKHDLDDCISDVYVVALKKSRELEKHPQIHGWLIHTARNISKRYIRRKMIEGMMFSESEDGVSIIPTNNDEEKRLYNELLDLLQKSLKRSEYKLFVLKFVEKCSNPEIASVIGIKVHSVESRITRLKNKIKDILRET